MDRHQVLEAFDEQLRRHPREPDARTESDEFVTRVRSEHGGWSGVTWSQLDAHNADDVIAEQIDRFTGVDNWEWKHYSYDEPPDLPERLEASGFTREPAETVLVTETAALALDVVPPPGIEIVPVTDEAGVAAYASVHAQVFGGGRFDAHLLSDPQRNQGFLAMAGTLPVAAARVELLPGIDFAGLWGGGTLPAWRGRGVFRALVAHRAAIAADRGFRYLQVDASNDSRPILERLGFVALATTTPFTYAG